MTKFKSLVVLSILLQVVLCFGEDKPQVGTGTSSHSSGFFAPIFSSTHSGGSVSEGHSSFGG